MPSSPFYVRNNVTVIAGGLLKEPWVVEPMPELGYEPFLEIGMNDRKLARAVGLDCNERAPFARTTLIQYLAKARNDKVDELIIVAKKGDDPMADVSTPTKRGKCSVVKHRDFEFTAAKVPRVVPLQLPAFTATDGTCVGGIVMNVIATVRVDVHVSMELTDVNLEWFAQAIHVSWDVRDNPWAKKTRDRASMDDEGCIADLPRLQSPNTRYAKRGRGEQAVVARYFDNKSNTWKVHSRTLGKHFLGLAKDRLDEHVAAIDNAVQQFYDTHHHEPGADGVAHPVGARDTWSASGSDVD